MDCSSEPGVIAAGAGALPGARRRCEAGTRTYGRATRACLALLAATALLAMAAPAQAQTTTVTQSGEGATWSLVGENTVAAGQTYTYTLTRTAGSLPENEYLGFTSDTLEEERFKDGTSDCTGTHYFCFTISNTADRYEEYTVSGVRFAGRRLTDTSPHVLTLNVATGTPTGTTVTLGVVDAFGIPRSGGLLITVGTATTNTAPTAANKTVTTGEDRAYAFTADDFGFDDDDAGATLASVTIVTVPAAGTLALDGTAVMADDVVTKDQIDGDMLTFTPARDAHGDPYTTFTFTVNDGTDDSASAYTMTIDVTDAPLPVCGVPDIAGAGRREIWSGEVTVEEFSFMGSVTGYGFDGVLPAGTLLPSQSFFIGSNNYVIDAITVSLSGSLHFSLDGFSFLTATETAALRLHVCDGDYDFSTANNSQQNTTPWSTTLDWSPPVESRTVYLSLPANNDATGAPAITGTAQAGQDLTADASPIMDTDGLPSSFTYQWVRVDADGMSNPADITDATAATYTLTAADAGKKIKVQVSFTDELSGEEERTSAAYPSSGTVTTAPALLSVTVTSTPRKTTDTYGAREHIEFSMTFDAPVTVTGDPTFAFDLGGATTATWYAGSGTTTLRFSHAVTGGSMRRPGHERDFLGRERDCAQRRHHRGDRQRGGGGPDPRRPVEPGGAQGRRPDDGRHARHGHGRGGDLDADVDGVGLVHGGHLRFRRDDRDHGHRQRGGGGGGRSRVPILADQPRQCRQQPAGHLRSHAQHRDDDGIHLHGAGGRPGHQRHLDRHPQPNLHAWT